MLESIKAQLFKGNTILMTAILGIVFVFAVVITLMFVIRGSRLEMTTTTDATPHSYNPSLDIAAYGIEKSSEPLRLADFMLDESIDPVYESHYYFYREERSSWPEEDISRFWIPIREITVDIVAHENDKKIESIFK